MTPRKSCPSLCNTFNDLSLQSNASPVLTPNPCPPPYSSPNIASILHHATPYSSPLFSPSPYSYLSYAINHITYQIITSYISINITCIYHAPLFLCSYAINHITCIYHAPLIMLLLTHLI